MSTHFIKNCMKYDHQNNFGLFKFQSGYRKIYLNSPIGYSRKQIYAQTATLSGHLPKTEIPFYPVEMKLILSSHNLNWGKGPTC